MPAAPPPQATCPLNFKAVNALPWRRITEGTDELLGGPCAGQAGRERHSRQDTKGNQRGVSKCLPAPAMAACLGSQGGLAWLEPTAPNGCQVGGWGAGTMLQRTQLHSSHPVPRRTLSTLGSEAVSPSMHGQQVTAHSPSISVCDW